MFVKHKILSGCLDVWQGYIRSSSGYLQVARQLEVFVGGAQESSSLGQFEQAMGVAQHHDSVSGTEKQVCMYACTCLVGTHMCVCVCFGCAYAYVRV